MLERRTWREERTGLALLARNPSARKRATLANARGGLDFVESVVVLLTVVQGKDGT